MSAPAAFPPPPLTLPTAAQRALYVRFVVDRYNTAMRQCGRSADVVDLDALPPAVRLFVEGMVTVDVVRFRREQRRQVLLEEARRN